jgi:acyl dehydratase
VAAERPRSEAEPSEVRAGPGGRLLADRQLAGRQPAGEAEREPFPTATGPELPAVRKVVDARRCWMFSGPGRNYHTDREAARQLGFPNIVVQGMMSTCFVAQVMQDAFGMGWVEGGRMSVKLVNVLWVDEAVTTHARVREEVAEGDRVRVHCDVWVDKDDGTRVLAGTASALRPPG